MNILVCMKAVPSTSQVQVGGQYKLRRDGVKLEWNLSDQAALEAALRLRRTDDSITVITMGPSKLEENMRELFARGADRAVLVTDPAFAGSDTYATANILQAAVKKAGTFDLILCGRRAIDGETGQVPPMLSCSIGVPCITNVNQIQCTNNKVNVIRQLENGTQHLELPCPVLISVCEYAYPLRLPGILGMRKAKNKSVEIISFSDLSIDKSVCGLEGSLTKVITMDAKFPGLRKGPKESDLTIAIPSVIGFLKEARQ